VQRNPSVEGKLAKLIIYVLKRHADKPFQFRHLFPTLLFKALRYRAVAFAGGIHTFYVYMTGNLLCI
jgi:hypothetical protein